MPALNFTKQFASIVEDGTKRQTIRARRRDGRPPCQHADTLFLYTGMRTKACRKLGEGIVVKIAPIDIKDDGRIVVSGKYVGGMGRSNLAAADGFNTPTELVEWIRGAYGLPFNGWLIKWVPVENA